MQSKKKALKNDPPKKEQPYIQTRLFILIAIILAAATIGVYWQSLYGQYVNYDDHLYVRDNALVNNGLKLESIKQAFITFHQANWHPLTWLSHMLDVQLYGKGPIGQHLTNLLLHTANTILILLILTMLTGRIWRSAFVAALFALHPLHVESVAWIAERKDVLSTFFWLLTTLAYIKYVRRPECVGKRWNSEYITILVLYILGLMAKPMLVTLPITLLILDYWPLERVEKLGWEALIREKYPMLLIAGISSVITINAQRFGGTVVTLGSLPLSFRLHNSSIAIIEYIRQMFWPAGLCCFYPPHLQIWYSVFAGILIIGFTTLVLTVLRRHRYITAGWLWYLVTLIPVIGLVQVGGQARADRYTYIPLIGLFVMIAWGVPHLLERFELDADKSAKVMAIPAMLVLAVLSIFTVKQIGYWHDEFSLFSHAEKVTTENSLAYCHTATVYAKEGNIEKALRDSKLAAKYDPGNAEPQNNIGKIYLMQNRPNEAIDAYEASLKINPADEDAHNDLAIALSKCGRTAEAEEQYKEAIRLAPQRSDFYSNYATMLYEKGDNSAAVVLYRKALNLSPANKKAQIGLRYALKGSGRPGKGSDIHKKAYMDQNKREMIHKLIQQKDFGKAEKMLREELAGAQNSPDMHYMLGNILALQSKVKEAADQFTEALKVSPTYAPAHIGLSNLLIMQGKLKEAEAHLKEAIRIDPNMGQAHFNLAYVYYLQKMYDRSWKEVKLSKQYGYEVPQEFLYDLSQQMPEPS